MTAWPWIAAGVGAAAVTGAYLLRRSKGDAPEAPPADACEKLPTQQLRDACKAIKAGAAILGAIPNPLKSKEATNVEKNGPVTERIHRSAYELIYIERGPTGGMGYSTQKVYPLYTTAIRHQNGCVPIPGNPEWSKCAQGTKSIVWSGHDDPTKFDKDTWWGKVGLEAGYHPSGLLSGGRPKDVYTFKWPENRPWPGPSGPGERWVVRGQLKVINCPAGQTVNIRVRDHRGGAPSGEPTCSPPTPEPPPTVPQGGYRTGGTTTTTSDGGSRRDHRSDPPR